MLFCMKPKKTTKKDEVSLSASQHVLIFLHTVFGSVWNMLNVILSVHSAAASLGTPVRLLIGYLRSSNHIAATLHIRTCRHSQDELLKTECENVEET